MILFPNAKINLGLRIVSRRPDGYHNLVSVMIPVGWHDILELTPSTDGTDALRVSGRCVDCPPERNLVIRALTALRNHADVPPVRIHLHKIIPDGAGLGGGSADAAFTLTGLNELFGLNLDNDRLASIAGGLGADCPLFIYNRPMLATGTGTTLTPVEHNPVDGMWILIAKPARGVSTAMAYSRVTPAPEDTPLTELLAEPLDSWHGRVINDFEQSVFPQIPECAALKESLYTLGAGYASLSGSGSAVYGLYTDYDTAWAASVKLADTGTNCTDPICLKVTKSIRI